MLTNHITMAISSRDTLRPLGIWFRPCTVQRVYMTLDATNNVVVSHECEQSPQGWLIMQSNGSMG